MRSLKLSGLIRRNPDRPTLKQRATALKATAGRVIRSPKSGSPKDLIARAKQHPGMMAYPAERPTSLVAVRFGLRLEAQRLLATALDEFARLYEAQSEGAGEATCRKIEERLKRELRIDALRVAAEDADPDATAGLMLDLHAMAGGVIHDDGKVSFCDAAGAVHRKPVADWIGFTSSRLYVSARKEMARQINDPSLDDADRAALALKLRRDLRLDALHILACRSFEAFDLTQARTDAAEGAVIPEPRQYRAGPVSMDLQRAIEAHREAVQMAVVDPVDDADRAEARSARIRALADAVREIPARSHADLRHKAIYLWPGNIEGETVGEDLSESLISIFHDIERLGSASAPEGDAVDPILAAIAASREAEAMMAEWQKRTGGRPGGLTEALFAEEQDLCAIQRRTRDAAFSTIPTTHAGRLALVEYIRFVRGFYGITGGDNPSPDDAHVWKETHAALMAALASPIAIPAPINHDLVVAQGLYAKALDLSGVSFGNLTLLYEQFYHVADAFLTLSNDDSLWDDEKRDYTPGGTLLDAESNRLGCLRDAIADELERRRPTKTDDRDGRLLALVMQELRCEGRIRNDTLLSEINAAWGA